jgi:hypothetical protein
MNQPPPNETTSAEPAHRQGVAAQVSGAQVIFGPGLAGRVSAERNLEMDRASAFAVAAGADLAANRAGAQVWVAGRDASLANGVAQVVVVGRDLQLDNSAAGVIKAGGGANLAYSLAGLAAGEQVAVENSRVGVVLARRVVIGEGSQVLVSTRQAAAFGAAFGLVLAVLSWLFRRR